MRVELMRLSLFMRHELVEGRLDQAQLAYAP
jgi:hypothetical protein